MNAGNSYDLRLSTRACTTGWSDWTHGELWIGDRGALRIDRGIFRTLVIGGLPRLVFKDAVRSYSETEIAELQDRSKRTLWVPWTEVTRAVIQRNMFSNIVRMETPSGKMTFWCLKSRTELAHIMEYLAFHEVPMKYARFARFLPAAR